MSLLPIDPQPGLMIAGTRYQSKGRYREQNFMRWHERSMMPIGGWTARTDQAITGKGRAMLTWVSNDLERYIAIGTEQKLYATTSSDTGVHDITPVGFVAGDADAAAAGGYGSGPYGEGTYGTPRTDVAEIQDASMWTLDTFGEDLLACMAEDGVIYRWQLNTGVAAATLTNAPTGCVGVVVTPERFVLALGAGGDKRAVAWSDQEAPTVWAISVTNQAGDAALATQGRIMCGRRLRASTLIWTDLDVHQMTYIGPPFVYSIERQGENCGVISRGAVVVADTRAVWMSQSSFKMFDGFVQDIACEIHDAVFSDMNTTQKSKFTAQHRVQYGEIWFLYCSAASTEIDRAAVWNYKENHWNLHDLSDMATTRLCGADRGVFQNPIMVGNDGLLYDHEIGTTYDGATPYARLLGIELGAGDRLMKCREWIPDEATQGEWQVTFYPRDNPEGAESTAGPYSASAGYVPVRFEGRQTDMLIELVTPSPSSRWGVQRLDVSAGARR